MVKGGVWKNTEVGLRRFLIQTVAHVDQFVGWDPEGRRYEIRKESMGQNFLSSCSKERQAMQKYFSHSFFCAALYWTFFVIGRWYEWLDPSIKKVAFI